MSVQDFKLPQNKFFYGGLMALVGVLFGIAIFTLPQYSDPTNAITSEAEGLTLIFNTYPELRNNGFGQVYFSELIGENWYIAVGYGGSGVPIIGGDCFRINSDLEIERRALRTSSSIIEKIDPVSCEGL